MSSSRPRVSIITRTKDRPLYLHRALSSVTGQTLREWELIIVNDGGDPRILRDVVGELDADDRRKISIIDHPQSRGRWQAANAGVRAAVADYVVLHDDDDSWAPVFLERAVGYLDAHPEREGVVSRIEIVWESREKDRIKTTGREPFLRDSVAPLLMDQQRFNQFVPIAFVYRRALHDEIGLYDEQLPVIGAWEFNTRVLQRGPLEYLGSTPLAYWHQRPSANGADGNSVILASEDHRLHDALLRDAEFRSLVNRDGSGAALYFERRLRETEELIKREFADLKDAVAHPLRSLWRTARQRLLSKRR